MFIGILFSIIVSLSISAFCFLVFYNRKKIDEQFSDNVHISRAFVFFWFLMGFVWLLVSITDFFAYLEIDTLAVAFAYVLQIFVGGSLVVAFYFTYAEVARSTYRSVFTFFYVLVFLFFVLSLFLFGLEPIPGDFFSRQFIISQESFYIYTLMFVPIFLLSIILLVKSILWRPAFFKIQSRRFHLFAGLAFVVLGLSGTIDEIGLVFSWVLSTARLLSLIASIFAFIAISALQESRKLVI